jgi:hypothetical protein
MTTSEKAAAIRRLYMSETRYIDHDEPDALLVRRFLDDELLPRFLRLVERVGVLEREAAMVNA